MIPILALLHSGLLLAGSGQDDGSLVMSIEDPRPLAKAIEALERKYGWIITYEDPRYAHASELLDQTAPELKGSESRALGPKGGSFKLSYRGRKSDTPAMALDSLLRLHEASGNAGHFTIRQTGRMFHVVPTQIKDKDGRLVAQASILDVPIDLREEERSGYKALEDICAAIGKATQKRVGVGTIPLNLMLRQRTRLGESKMTGREVLVRLIEETGANLSWQLLYDPGMDWYALNLQVIP